MFYFTFGFVQWSLYDLFFNFLIMSLSAVCAVFYANNLDVGYGD